VGGSLGYRWGQVEFNPHDGTLVTCSGNQIFKSFRVAESNLKPLAPMLGKREPQVRLFLYRTVT
jgi:hypothetical protein